MISSMLLSGGTGSRSGKNIPKQYCELCGKMIIKYCLDELVKAELTDEVVIVYGDGFLDLLKSILKDYSLSFKSVKYVAGGETRQESVYNGLKECSYKTVLLHESARPLITAENLKTIIGHRAHNVTMGIDIPFTVLKRENGMITGVLKREELFNVQLPQKFDRDTLIDAHNKALQNGKSFTDDSSLIFHYNNEVAVIPGSEENIKITTPGDFAIAEEIIKNRNTRF